MYHFTPICCLFAKKVVFLQRINQINTDMNLETLIAECTAYDFKSMI